MSVHNIHAIKSIFIYNVSHYAQFISVQLFFVYKIDHNQGLTISDPGYFRQLTIRGGGGGGALKAPPPTISKTIVSIFTISHM